jgi:hypothetical protein
MGYRGQSRTKVRPTGVVVKWLPGGHPGFPLGPHRGTEHCLAASFLAYIITDIGCSGARTGRARKLAIIEEAS